MNDPCRADPRDTAIALLTDALVWTTCAMAAFIAIAFLIRFLGPSFGILNVGGLFLATVAFFRSRRAMNHLKEMRRG